MYMVEEERPAHDETKKFFSVAKLTFQTDRKWKKLFCLRVISGKITKKERKI